MQYLKTGRFFGINKRQSDYNGLIVSDTEYYSVNDVPWHYHENPHFVYFISGHVMEVNKKYAHPCISKTLVFHNWQESHRNLRHSDYMHCLNMELDKNWLQNHQLDLTKLEGSIYFDRKYFQTFFNLIYKETYINDSASRIATEGLVLQVFAEMSRQCLKIQNSPPSWVDKVKEYIHDQCSERLTLTALSNEVQLNSTYLSQAFPKYFNTTFGDYLRKARVAKATSLLTDKRLTLSEIAFDCGFSDQSHFMRCFKHINGFTPTEYRRIILHH